MKPLFEKDLRIMDKPEDDFSRELIILDLVPGIIHEINNSLASSMASAEILREELVALRTQTNENNINLNLLNHIEKLSSLNKSSTLRIQNILAALLKEEINKLKDQCTKKNIDNSKFDHLDKLINLNIDGVKRIDLITKALRRLVSFEEDIALIDVNEVVKTSVIVLQDHLKNRYTIREEFSELPMVNFNFHELNYSIICILLKTIELMDSGELHLKTFQTDNNVHVNIKLIGGEISKDSLESIMEGTNPKSKIDLHSINKLLLYKGGKLDIKKPSETIYPDSKNEILGGIIFDIKIKKNNVDSFTQTEFNVNNIYPEGISFTQAEVKDLEYDNSNLHNKENGHSNNILVVDDDPQTLVSLFLSLKHYDLANKVIIAKTAEAGIEQFKERDFCLVICDYRLPGMDGISFLSYIKEKYPNTTRILITAYPNSVLKEEASTKASVKFLIEKPWIAADLNKIMQQINEINIK